MRIQTDRHGNKMWIKYVSSLSSLSTSISFVHFPTYHPHQAICCRVSHRCMVDGGVQRKRDKGGVEQSKIMSMTCMEWDYGRERVKDEGRRR